MIEQGNRTQQLIYRTSYRKHKERLADIRQNITAHDFLPPRMHHSAKRQPQKVRIIKEDLDSGQAYMKGKLNAIKHRANSKIDDLFSTEQMRKQPKRYFDQSNQVKVELNSEANDGDHIKFVLPTQKNPSASFSSKIKDGQKAENTVAQTKMNSIEKSYKKYSSNSVLKDTQRDIKTAKQPQLFYNLPQRNENRVVMYKKTLVFSSMQSCMLEISLINERLLIAAYLMGLQNTTLRQLYSLKRTGELLKECENNYEQLCSRISIEKANQKYQFIRISPKQEESKETEENQEDKNKQKIKIQTEFIKRNYYTLVKNDEQQKDGPKQSKPSFTFDHVQAIVERLAVPKRYFKLKDEKQRPKALSNFQKPANSYQFSHQQLTHPEKRSSVQKKQYHNQSKKSINNIKQQENYRIAQKPSKNHLSTSEKQKSFEKIENKTIIAPQKNAEENYDEEYQEEFDNPSQIKKSNVHSMEASKPINNSIVSNQSKQSKTIKQSMKIEKKNESQVYLHEFQNQPEEQYLEQFENNNESHSPVAKIANNSPAPAQNVEQQYQQEFVD